MFDVTSYLQIKGMIATITIFILIKIRFKFAMSICKTIFIFLNLLEEMSILKPKNTEFIKYIALNIIKRLSLVSISLQLSYYVDTTNIVI